MSIIGEYKEYINGIWDNDARVVFLTCLFSEINIFAAIFEN